MVRAQVADNGDKVRRAANIGTIIFLDGEEEDPACVSDVMKSRREAYEFQLAIAQRLRSRRP
jgi:hypothetical protein